MYKMVKVDMKKLMTDYVISLTEFSNLTGIKLPTVSRILQRGTVKPSVFRQLRVYFDIDKYKVN